MVEKRSELSQEEHDKLVSEIAKKRFSYKDGSVTYANPNGEKNFAVDDQYPDIVVVKDETVQTIGEVETEETITENEAEQWETYATLNDYFYLYVPKTKVADAKTIIENKKVGIKGLRSYEYVSDELVIKNIEI